MTLALDLPPDAGYPFSLGMSVTYALSESGLAVRVTATNRGEVACPFGAGAHPYVRLAGDGLIDDALLHLPADATLEADERGIPTGDERPVDNTAFDFRESRTIGGVVLDTAFTQLRADKDGIVRIALTTADGRGGAGVWMDSVPSLRDDLQRRHAAGRFAPPPRPGHRTDDLCSRRIQLRRRVDRAPTGRSAHRHVGNIPAVASGWYEPPMTATSRPSLALFISEPGRAIADYGAMLASAPMLLRAPRGDGHSVLVLPGLLGDGRFHGNHAGVPALTWLCGPRLAPRPQPGPDASDSQRHGRAARRTA